LEKLQRIASAGIPDGGGLRATAWKVMLEKKNRNRNLLTQIMVFHIALKYR